MFNRKILIGSLVTLGLILFTACVPFPDFSLKFSGGGHIPSAEDPEKKAIFGFHYDGTTEPAKMHGTYHDKAADVHIKISEINDIATGTGDSIPYMAAEIIYEPIGAQLNADEVGVLACDEVSEEELTGLNEDFVCEAYPCDFILIVIYEEGQEPVYENSGQVMGGNLKNLDKE